MRKSVNTLQRPRAPDTRSRRPRSRARARDAWSRTSPRWRLAPHATDRSSDRALIQPPATLNVGAVHVAPARGGGPAPATQRHGGHHATRSDTDERHSGDGDGASSCASRRQRSSGTRTPTTTAAEGRGERRYRRNIEDALTGSPTSMPIGKSVFSASPASRARNARANGRRSGPSTVRTQARVRPLRERRRGSQSRQSPADASESVDQALDPEHVQRLREEREAHEADRCEERALPSHRSTPSVSVGPASASSSVRLISIHQRGR